MARSLLMDAAGGAFLVPAIGTPPRPREKRMLRDTFLIARPPLLAVVRGGGICHFENSPQLGQQCPHGEENKHDLPVRGRRERSERGGSLTRHLELQFSNTAFSRGYTLSPLRG